jgi:hypothetical protein
MTDQEEFSYLQRQSADEVMNNQEMITLNTDMSVLVSILCTLQVGVREAPNERVSSYLMQLSSKLEDKFLKEMPATRKFLNFGWSRTMDYLIEINKL